MSATNRTAGSSRSNDHVTTIFQVALNEYQRTTGKLLDTHLFTTQLGGRDSPEAALNVFRTQTQTFSKFRKSDEKLMKLMNPIVHIVFIFSETLEKGIGLKFSPAITIFTGISELLMAARDVVVDTDTLTHLFEHIHFFLQRLNKYIRMPLQVIDEWTELLGKLMVQILSILALSTRAMTERRIKKFITKLEARRGVDNTCLRLDSLTRDVAEALDVACDRNQLRANLRIWLSPPDPEINHSIARHIQRHGTASWFFQGSTFREWKENENGSLLWIRGNPGSGKSILCSAIIEDVKSTLEERSALVAYHYFDSRDRHNRDVRGLLASLFFQLCDACDSFQDVLHELYKSCHDGFEQPSDVALVNCLKAMVELRGRLPIFIIIDALDECPDTTGTPSAREEVLDFVEDLVVSNHSNLFLCITSRPEQDIRTVLNPLTSASRRVSLNEEGGQREDIYNYVRSYVQTDNAMRRWRVEDKELVINTLQERADGMFRWVFCQLDTLHRSLPSSIRKVLDELPATLDDTYERTLEGIPKEKRQHAHRLFQCLVTANRPLRVEELAEIFAIEFGPNTAHLMEDWRPQNPEDAILSSCSTLITFVEDDHNSKIVQFSHFSVKEFLTSDRFQASEMETIRPYYVSLDAAHTFLAQACLTVLLQLGETMDDENLAPSPLASYAAHNWFVHARCKDVASSIPHAMERFFFDVLADYPRHPEATALYYAVLCGHCGLANYLISRFGEDVRAKCGFHGTPLHAASWNGHLGAVTLLLGHGADVNLPNEHGRTPLCEAYYGRHLEVMRALLDCGAAVDVHYDDYGLLIHDASYTGEAEVIRLLLQHNADVDATSYQNYTPLHWASSVGHANVVQILLEYGADINSLSDFGTPLYRASVEGHLEVTKLLLGCGADVHIRVPSGETPFQVATRKGHAQVAQLLLEHGAGKE